MGNYLLWHERIIRGWFSPWTGMLCKYPWCGCLPSVQASSEWMLPLIWQPCTVCSHSGWARPAMTERDNLHDRLSPLFLFKGSLKGKYQPMVLQPELTPQTEPSPLTRDQYPLSIKDVQRPDDSFTYVLFFFSLCLCLWCLCMTQTVMWLHLCVYKTHTHTYIHTYIWIFSPCALVWTQHSGGQMTLWPCPQPPTLTTDTNRTRGLEGGQKELGMRATVRKF